MASGRAQIQIDQPVDVVWKKVGDFGDVSWIPRTASCRFDGTDRAVRMEGMDFELVQRLLHFDEAGHAYTYRLANPEELARVLGPGREAPSLEATITVMPVGSSAAEVVWDVETTDALVEGAAAEYQRALENLKSILEH